MKLNFEHIRKRIEAEKKEYKGSWAKFVGVPSNVVSNIHGKMQQKPSFPYIISVAQATGKPVDYYLWGDDSQKKENLPKVVIEHHDIIKGFKDPVLGKTLNKKLIDIQDTDNGLFKSAVQSIDTLWDAANVIKAAKGQAGIPPSEEYVKGGQRFKDREQQEEGEAHKNGTSGK